LVPRRKGLDMKGVAVFGNAGAGKSTLARRLIKPPGLPLYLLDLIRARGHFGPLPKN
jgi:hypothetical protein